MDAIFDRLPTRDWLERNRGKLGGAFTGFFGSLLLMAFFGVVYSGEGLGVPPKPVPQVYFP